MPTKLFGLLSLLALSLSTSAQQPPTASPPVRDAQATALVQSAITAMGGVSAIAAIGDSTVTGTEQYSADPDPNPATFSWQTSGVEFCNTVQNSTGTYAAVSGHGVRHN